MCYPLPTRVGTITHNNFKMQIYIFFQKMVSTFELLDYLLMLYETSSALEPPADEGKTGGWLPSPRTQKPSSYV